MEKETDSVIGTVLTIQSNNQDLFWKGIEIFHGFSNLYNDNRLYVWFALSNGFLQVKPIVGPNMTGAQLTAILKPLFDALRAANVPVTSTTTSHNSFYEMYAALFDDDSANFNGLIGGRIITRQDITENNRKIVDAYKSIIQTATQNGGFGAIGGHLVGPGKAVPVADNSIHPVWRDAVAFNLIVFPVAENAGLAQRANMENVMTNNMGKVLREAAPRGGAYVNEVSFFFSDGLHRGV